MTSFRNSNLAQAWLVLVLAVVFGTTLAGIQMKLTPVIEANKVRETMEKIPTLVLDSSPAPGPGAEDLMIRARVIQVEKKGIITFYPVYDVELKDGSPAGHVAKARGQGYADKIEVLVGLDAGGNTITGLFILDQKETPGLGNRILEKQWLDQFVHKSSDTPLVVVKSGAGQGSEMDGRIDGISGATISSRSVASIVNTTISDIRPWLVPVLNHKALNNQSGNKENGKKQGIKIEETR
jgi:electron transport complex protein RnfG